jgi:hypothetical protein
MRRVGGRAGSPSGLLDFLAKLRRSAEQLGVDEHDRAAETTEEICRMRLGTLARHDDALILGGTRRSFGWERRSAPAQHARRAVLSFTAE